MDVKIHAVAQFYLAKNYLRYTLKSGANPIMTAIVKTYKELLANPLVHQKTDQRDGEDFLHVLHQDYKLVYRVEPEFQGESTLIAQHVFLKNIIRKK